MGVLYLFVAFFWSLYDQTSSAWVLQAGKMNLNLGIYTPEPAETHTLNPVLILIFIWGPIPATHRAAGIIVFSVLALGGTEVLRRQIDRESAGA